MRFINWNISYAGDTENKFSYLKTIITEDTCVMLQEVKPHAYEYIKEQLQNDYHLFYSLNYRKPSKFDSDARKLGVLIIIHKSIDNVDAFFNAICPDGQVKQLHYEMFPKSRIAVFLFLCIFQFFISGTLICPPNSESKTATLTNLNSAGTKLPSAISAVTLMSLPSKSPENLSVNIDIKSAKREMSSWQK